MRKVFLLLIIAFIVVCFGYPCIILPFGEYKYETKIGDSTVVVSSFKFKFNGEVKYKYLGFEGEGFYKLKGNKVIISNDKKFDSSDLTLKITSMYNIAENENLVGQIIMATVGIVAALLVVTIPKKRK